jgi:hypothetical protein
MPRTGQRFCSHACRQAALRWRKAKKSGAGVTPKRRLYPATGKRHENAEFANGNSNKFSPPIYYFVRAGASLSDVEIAALGGFLVKLTEVRR